MREREYRVEVNLNEAGRGSVTLDGADISDLIDGFTLVAKAGELPRLTVSIPAVAVKAAVTAGLLTVADE